ncbi:hypothetical protein CA2015_2821 [Cyclobacterium amurskyense]|uniref:Uncharacterized protein n=1 Tax=Cyclobacterium amurskyense TaxID=320787 RepID=A0A0H4PDA1_9BACT|nr:hypothetical protein CA2015_2821 [Cyclobacterium amurskyense]
MKKIIENNISFGVSIIGIIGGSIWAYKSNFDPEPLILIALSLFQFFGYLYLCFFGNDEELRPQFVNNNTNDNRNRNSQNVEVTVNVDPNKSNTEVPIKIKKPKRHLIVEEYKYPSDKLHLLRKLICC